MGNKCPRWLSVEASNAQYSCYRVYIHHPPSCYTDSTTFRERHTMIYLKSTVLPALYCRTGTLLQHHDSSLTPRSTPTCLTPKTPPLTPVEAIAGISFRRRALKIARMCALHCRRVKRYLPRKQRHSCCVYDCIVFQIFAGCEKSLEQAQNTPTFWGSQARLCCRSEAEHHAVSGKLAQGQVLFPERWLWY